MLDVANKQTLLPGRGPSPWQAPHLVGAGAGEAAEGLGPARGSLQLAALGRGAGVHPHRAVTDGETGLERRGEGLGSAC